VKHKERCKRSILASLVNETNIEDNNEKTEVRNFVSIVSRKLAFTDIFDFANKKFLGMICTFDSHPLQ
jgi:hypothetical protein